MWILCSQATGSPLTKVLPFSFDQYNIRLQGCISISYYTLPKRNLGSLLDSHITTYRKEAQNKSIKRASRKTSREDNIWAE